MSHKIQVFVALLATCVFLVNADSTKNSSENENTSAELYDTASPDSTNQCENLTMETMSKTHLLPSAVAVFKCSCNNKDEPALCPELDYSLEALGKVITVIDSIERTNTSCSTVWYVGTFESAFNRRRVEAHMFCLADYNTTASQMVVFEKQGNKDSCEEDVDCWSEDQICQSNQCSCYNDTPSFVRMENKCYQAASYGQRCEYDEQCMSKDEHSICKENVCKCQDNYLPKNATDWTCTEKTQKCENLTMETIPQTYLYPSGIAVIKCSCQYKYNVPAVCPELHMSQEAQGKVKTISNTKNMEDQSCSMEWQVGALESAFNRRRVEVAMFCQSDLNTTESQTVVFEKQTDQGICKEDVDCWSEDQVCRNGKCSCYDDTPTFVKEENICYPASSYGQRCEYDEQCLLKDKHTTCNGNVCKCQENYWTKSKTDLTCTDSSMSIILKSSQILVATAAGISMVLLFNVAY